MPTATARVADEEEEPLIRNDRRNPTVQTKEGFYFGCPNVPDENRYEYFTVFCTLILCVIFFVMIPIFALLISGDRACDTSRLKGVTSPYKDELVPKMPVMVEYYTDWYQYSKLFDVYDGAATSATSADKAGYYYYVNILGFLRFGYADQDERVWFEGKYNGFGARLKPYADMEATRCEGEETKYRVTEDYWDRTWFCWSRCERHFHVYRRKDEKSEFKPYADAVFYDEPRYDYGSDYGFDSQTASLNARSMNLTDAKSGNLISRAQLTLGDPYAEVRLGVYPPPARPRPKANPPTHITHLPTLHFHPPPHYSPAPHSHQIGLAALNRWTLDFSASEAGLKESPPHWLVTFVVAMDDVPNRSVAWLLAFFVFLSILGMMWLQNQERDSSRMALSRRWD